MLTNKTIKMHIFVDVVFIIFGTMLNFNNLFIDKNFAYYVLWENSSLTILFYTIFLVCMPYRHTGNTKLILSNNNNNNK